ncbi:MAG: MBL fold metallo-hydrolase [Patescibacteria group bacterium]
MKRTITTLLIILSFFYFLASIISWRESPYFRLIFLDVGQGDSVLIVTPHGQTILIDGGPDASVLKKLGTVLPFWLRKIDLVVLTHAHDDHLAGLIDVLNRYQIKQVLVGNYNNETSLIKVWQDRLISSRSEIIKAKEGMIFNFSDNCSLKILAAAEKATDENDLSIVSLFSCLDKNIFLGGDASSKIEGQINISKVDIAKISHHGSITSNSQTFLDKIKPSLAVISVGINNKFNHPSPIILNRLLTGGVNIFRTDQMGTVYFLANNKSIIWTK